MANSVLEISSMTPDVSRTRNGNVNSCGKKLLRISEQFSDSNQMKEKSPNNLKQLETSNNVS